MPLPSPPSRRAVPDTPEKDDVVRGFIATGSPTAYLSVKRAEPDALAGLGDVARCRRIADVH